MTPYTEFQNALLSFIGPKHVGTFEIFIFLFYLFKIYLKLTVNKYIYIYIACLKTMLIYVNFHEKEHIYIKKLLKI